MSKIQIIHNISEIRDAISTYRKQGLKIALVPTMGNLHAGHISLASTALEHADIVCATIFVNPKQFGENEDFGSYPRTLTNDAQMLEDAGVQLIFAPSVAEMYPNGFATNVSVSDISVGLCGGERPGHFDGVCTVVTKLFLQTLPDMAFFGEKDFQQLLVIKKFSRDLNIPVDIRSVPTLREDDGLAMSSRNGYLTVKERQIAPTLYSVMKDTVRTAKYTTSYEEILTQAKTAVLNAGFDKIDYFQICDEVNLKQVNEPTGKPQRLFAAAYLGKARLIDNIPL